MFVHIDIIEECSTSMRVILLILLAFCAARCMGHGVICDTLSEIETINFERMKNFIVGSRQRYEAAVEEAGGCEALGIGKGGGYGNTIWELKGIIRDNVGNRIRHSLTQLGNGKFDDLAILGRHIDEAIGKLESVAAREASQSVTTNSREFVTQSCSSDLRLLAKDLFVWRNFLYSYGVAVTNRIDQCTRGLGDVPLFKEARGRKNPIVQIMNVRDSCRNVLDSEGCAKSTDVRGGHLNGDL